MSTAGGFSESLGADKAKQRKHGHCPVVPSPRPVPAMKRPHNAQCFDGVMWRQRHDRDGRCYFWAARQAAKVGGGGEWCLRLSSPTAR